MPRYLITQSLVSSWAYMFDCCEGCEDDARQEFLQTLRRKPKESNKAMQKGIAFENAVYAEAAGLPRKPISKWERGIKAVAGIIRGAQVQVRASRLLEADGTEFLVYGILDALRAGTIYDVKFSTKALGKYDAYGKYLNSPQHPFYFYLVPEAQEFQYLLSDGDDYYIETYRREQTRSAAEIVSEFIRSITDMGLLSLYKEKWLAL